MKPCLTIANGRLQPVSAGDLESLVTLLHDTQVRRYLCDDTVLPRETVAGMLAASDDLDPQGLGLWAIEHTGDGFAGIVGLQPASQDAGSVPEMAGGIEPLIAIHPDHWGQELASTALGALIAYARDALKLSRLVAAVDRPNTRSHRLMQRCGFATIGTAPGPAGELVAYQLPLDGGPAGTAKTPVARSA